MNSHLTFLIKIKHRFSKKKKKYAYKISTISLFISRRIIDLAAERVYVGGLNVYCFNSK